MRVWSGAYYRNNLSARLALLYQTRDMHEENDFKDLMAEETTRGRPQPRKAVTLARQRMIKKLADMLADPRCDKRTFLAVIRDFGLKMDRPSFFSSATCGTRGA